MIKKSFSDDESERKENSEQSIMTFQLFKFSSLPFVK